EEIGIVVEHQDSHKLLQLAASDSLGRPVLFPLHRQTVALN
ncbi:hypothetical protein TNCV_765251, partial [Trichonephila clavipes]